jgi:hypothetical protein
MQSGCEMVKSRQRSLITYKPIGGRQVLGFMFLIENQAIET